MKKYIKYIGSILLVVCAAIGLVGCSQEAKSYNPGKTIKQTLTNKAFSNIKAELEISDVVIKTGKSFKVIYHGGKNLRPNVSVSNDTLTIKQDKDLPSTISTSATRLTIIVPNGKLSRINVENDAGDISLSKISANSLTKLEADSGDINISNSKLANTHIEAESGDINISNSPFDGYKLEADSGDIDYFNQTIENGSLKKNTQARNILEAESDSGDIVIE